MPIALGIACENCGRLHLLNKAGAHPNIYAKVSSLGADMFGLNCAVCKMARSFYKSDLKPYTVSADAQVVGHADRGEYVLVSHSMRPASWIKAKS
jgi:hypothetical protein